MHLNQVFNEGARRLLVHSEEEARILRNEQITSACIFIALLRSETEEVITAFADLGFTVENARSQVQQITGLGDWTHSAHLVFSRESFQILGQASLLASREGSDAVSDVHIMRAIFTEPHGVIEKLLGTTIQVPVSVARA